MLVLTACFYEELWQSIFVCYACLLCSLRYANATLARCVDAVLSQVRKKKNRQRARGEHSVFLMGKTA